MPDDTTLSSMALEALGAKGAGRVARQSLENALEADSDSDSEAVRPAPRARARTPAERAADADKLPTVLPAQETPGAVGARGSGAKDDGAAEEEDKWWLDWECACARARAAA